MAQHIEALDVPEVTSPTDSSWVDAEVEVSCATYQAYQIMYYAFIALFAVAGLDKFFHLLTTWDVYVSPRIASLFHLTTSGMTFLAGLIEIACAATVALKPRIGSWVITVWLWLIIIDLLTLHSYYDVVLQDAALSVAALAFTRLSAECN